MFARILVPLDGSEVAERALPLAARVAQSARAKLRLALVHQPVPPSAVPAGAQFSREEYEQSARKGEREYLREVAARLRESPGVAVTTVILDGSVAKTLAGEVDASGADLVAMTTHGRGPVSRFWMGSVADQLVRTLSVPILLLRADSEQDQAMPRRILVPLDGSRRAEGALDCAARFAKMVGGCVELLQVVPPIVPVVPDGSPLVPPVLPAGDGELLVESAQTYLETRAEWLRSDGIETRVHVEVDSSPATAIVAVSERLGADLVAIATHGAGGIRRMVLGSVTDKVLRSSRLPLLVVRP